MEVNKHLKVYDVYSASLWTPNVLIRVFVGVQDAEAAARDAQVRTALIRRFVIGVTDRMCRKICMDLHP